MTNATVNRCAAVIAVPVFAFAALLWAASGDPLWAVAAGLLGLLAMIAAMRA